MTPAPAPGACSLCGLTSAGPLVDAAGDIGVVHRSCFVRWDREQERQELELAGLHLPRDRQHHAAVEA